MLPKASCLHSTVGQAVFLRREWQYVAVPGIATYTTDDTRDLEDLVTRHFSQYIVDVHLIPRTISWLN